MAQRLTAARVVALKAFWDGQQGGVEGAGCFECGGTGYRGRTAIHELLDLSDHIRGMLLARRSTAELKRVAKEEGMTFLRESAVEKVRKGTTTLKEINKVTFIEG